MSETVRLVLTELQRRFRALYGQRLVHLVLFGSQARAQAESDSDIDVLVVLRGPVRPGTEIVRTGETTAALSLQYQVVISCTFLSLDRYTTEQSPLLLNIHREGIAL